MRGIKQVRAAILAAAIAGLGWSAPKVLGESVSFDFNSVESGLVSGSIDVTVVPDGIDTYLATGGGGSVTGTDGDYSFTFASDPGVSDNVISLDDSPAVDIKGLAFAGPDSSTPDLRYYSDGVGGLEWQTPSADVAVTDYATASVPLPASAGVGFGMLGSFGAMALLRKRLSRKSRIA